MVCIPNTLTFRLTLGYALSFVAFIGLAFLGLYLSIATIMNDEMEEDLIEDVSEYRQLLKREGMDALYKEIENEIQSSDASKEFIKLVDGQGQDLSTSDLSFWQNLSTDEDTVTQLTSDIEPVIDTIFIEGQEYETKIIYGHLGPDLVIQLGESLEQKKDILELLLTALIIMFCVVVPVSSIIGWVIVKKAVWGIEEVSNAAADIEKGRLGSRVSISGHNDEIQKLADTFNAMASRIQILMSEMRELTDNIAHDLRSPLGRIRVNAEMALSGDESLDSYRNASAETIEECDRLIQMINTSLDIAEAEAGLDHAKKEQLNISALTQDACELFEPVAESKFIDMTVTFEPVCQINGNRQNLQRMIANVLDNALKYTPENGKVDIKVDTNEQSTVITITDNGIGIPTSDQPKIFDEQI